MVIRSRSAPLKIRKPPLARKAEPSQGELDVGVEPTGDLLQMIREACHPDNKGFMLHVWPTKDGFQAGCAVIADGRETWASYTSRNPLIAIEHVVSSKLHVMRLHGKGKRC